MTKLDRCAKEQEQAIALIRAGHPETAGLIMALHDWLMEEAIIRQEVESAR
jgi:hypothetical protein